MPTYEFKCQTCKSTFEVIASMKDHDRMVRHEHRVVCTVCGSEDVAPQISEVQVRTTRKSA